MLLSKQTANNIFTQSQTAPLFGESRMDKVCSSMEKDVRKVADYQMNNPFSSFRGKNIKRVQKIECVFV